MFQAPQLPRKLSAALRDLAAPSAKVRASAALDLVYHGDEPDAREALRKALEDPEREVRVAAATALADVAEPESTDALIHALERETDVEVLQLCIAALGEAGDDRAAAAVRKRLKAREPELRFQAVMAFARLAPTTEDAVVALMQATQDDDPLVVHIALRMAEEIGDPHEDDVVEPRLLARAKALVRSDIDRVALVAAIIVARAGEKEGNPVLIRAVKGELKTDDPEDLSAAIELCGTLRLQKARRALERRAGGGLFGFGRDPLWWHARVALATMGHERAKREILDDLASWDRNKRTLAVAAAGRALVHDALALLEAKRDDDGFADRDAMREALEALRAG